MNKPITRRQALVALLATASGPAFSAGAAAHHTVEIFQFKFVPADIDIKAGDTVTWVNRDVVPHDVSPTSGDKSWQSLKLLTGDSFSLVVNASIDYRCSLHPVTMLGTIKVEQRL